MKPRKNKVITYLQRSRMSALAGALTIVLMMVIGIYLWIAQGEWVLFAVSLLGAICLIGYIVDSERHFRDDP